MSVVIRWTRDRWFLLGLACLLLNAWAVWRWESQVPRDGAQAPAAGDAVETEMEAHEPSARPLQLLSVNQVEFRPGKSCTLRLAFNAVPRRPQFEDYLQIQAGRDGSPLPYRLVGEVESRDVLVRMPSVTTDRLRVKLEAGLASVDGEWVLPQTVVRDFRCESEFVLTRVEPEINEPGQAAVHLHFSAPVDLRGIERLVGIRPEVGATFEHANRWGQNTVKILADFEPNHVYQVTLDPTVTSTLGKTLGRTVSRRVYIPNVPASIRIRGSGHYLSAAGWRQLRIEAVNVSAVEVRAERVHRNNLLYFAMRRAGGHRGYGWYNRDRAHEHLGERVGEQHLDLAAPPNTVREVALEMDALLGEEKTGAFVLHLQPDEGNAVRQLIVLTDIGLSVKQHPRGMLAWANSIRTAQPMEGVRVKVYTRSNQLLHDGLTDGAGLVRFAGGPAASEDQEPFLVTAERGEDLCYLPLAERLVALHGDTRGLAWPAGDLEAFLYTDRGIYRPGETVFLRAVVKDRDLASPDPFPVHLRVRAPDGKVSRTLTGMLGPYGTAQFEWNWPSTVPTGRHRLELLVPEAETLLGHLDVAVEEFVPPRIAATLLPGPERIRPEDGLRFELEARYLAGRAAGGRKAEGRVNLEAVPFSPEGYEDYIFHDQAKRFNPTVMTLGKVTLDEQGRAVFERKLVEPWSPPSAVHALLIGLVQDVDGRTTAAHGACLIDVYPRYIGLRTSLEGQHAPTGKTVPIQAVVVLPDGTLDNEPRSLTVDTSRLTWATVLKKSARGDYSYHSEQQQRSVSQDEVEAEGGCATHAFTAERPGHYRITVTDPASGSSSSIDLQVSTPGAPWVAWSMEKPDQVGLELDRERYHAGEEARLVMHAPFAGRALLSVETDHLLETRVVDVPAGRSEVTLHPAKTWVPNAYCTVSLVRPLQAGEEMLPHRAVGVMAVPVEEPERRFRVRLEAPEQTRPGEPLRVRLAVEDHDGQPVPAEVVVAAVDEGICRLTNFETPDPLSLFRGRRALASRYFDLYGALMPEFEETVLGTASASGGGAPGTARKHHLNPVRARRFRPVALWSGPVLTDASGHGTAEFDVPEFTGQLRLMAVAVGRQGTGHEEAKVKVARPVQAYAGLPRFLAPGDESRMTLTLVNAGPAARDIAWAIPCAGPVSVRPGRGSVSLEAGRETIVTLDLRAGPDAGTARVTLEVRSEDERFREETELAVRPPAYRQVYSGVVAVAPGSMEEVQIPGDWMKGTSDFGLMFAGFPGLKLGRSLDYLLRYPHGCLEQTTSSVFPLLYLADLAQATQPGSIAGEDTAGYVQEGVLRLMSMQQSQGGFGYWPRTRDIYPWGSLYATHFLVEADRAGRDVPGDRLDAALRYAENLLRAPAPALGHSEFSSDRLRRAYACLVLALADRPHHGWMGRLVEEVEDLDAAAAACLASALAVADRRPEALSVLGGMAPGLDPERPRQISGCLTSPVRDLGLLLSAWVEVDATDARAFALARRLEELEAGDRWATTHENAVALMALGKYARETQGQRLPFEGEISWGDGQVGRKVAASEMWCAEPGRLTGGKVTAVNYGPGQAYLYWKAAGVPQRGLPPEADGRVRIRRTVLDRDGHPLPHGPVSQGQLLVVELGLDTMGRQLDQLVIEDLLPAGLEPENSNLKTSEDLPWVRKQTQAPVRHREMRDDRVLIFPGAFTGKRSVYYLARAVTPGTYVWPAASVSCMYDPGIRSVHGAGTLEVKP